MGSICRNSHQTTILLWRAFMSKEENLIMREIPESGPLFVPMTNDYLFRAMLQRNEEILRGLTCALLSLKPEEIESVSIENPILLGEAIDNKTFILDVLVKLNNNKLINLEMQVINTSYWVERSLSYLCRTFDRLEKGERYDRVLPVHQIGILNYTLFEDAPEFYANYMLLNTRNKRIYSDKIKLSVLDLNRVDLATKEDKTNELDFWAKLFKSKTWEELRMLAEKEPIFKTIATEVRNISSEERIRMQCEAREDYNRSQASFHGFYQDQINELKDTIQEKDEALAEKDRLIEELQAKLAEKEN
ncbi:MAG: Rpn family recombination-promoting nuclease/putative transposase [Lachnospiraceae bacterium]|nr:Rpn family recombination-promoting nuclease/putative transposase [Lachnospiraceae bacterium]